MKMVLKLAHLGLDLKKMNPDGLLKKLNKLLKATKMQKLQYFIEQIANLDYLKRN